MRVKNVIRRGLLPASLAAAVSLLSACSGTSMLNTLNRSDHYRTHANLAYGEHARQTLDIYQPEENQSAQACLVVFVYGGSWEEGRKEQYGFVGAALAKLGHTVVIPDYRLYPEVRYPAFVEDIAQAVASEPVQSRVQSRPLVLMGHSAGAMMAGLVSYNPDYLKAVGLNKSAIDAYVSLAGPHDYFLPTDKPRWTKIFGEDEERQVTALTVEHIAADNPPTLILHGADDNTVTPRSAVSLEQKLKDAGVAVTRHTYEGVDHVSLIAATAWPLRWRAPTLKDVDGFLRSQCNTAMGNNTQEAL